MNISLSSEAGDALCKSIHFSGLYSIITIEDFNSLKLSIEHNLMNTLNHVYRINGKFINGQWTSINLGFASTYPLEGSCAVVSHDGLNFSVKTFDCSAPLKVICGYGISPPYAPTLAPTTLPAPTTPIPQPKIPNFSMCATNSVFTFSSSYATQTYYKS